jgi:drug/metabolite transporter (DMT)-like permease
VQAAEHALVGERFLFMAELIGIVLALGCALTTNIGFLYKHRGACEAPDVDIRRPVWTAKALFSSRLFAIGMLVACGSWIFHIAAMAFIPLSIVQAVLAGGVVMLALMAERMLGIHLGRRQWLGLGLTAGGLALLGLTMPVAHGAHSHFSDFWMITFEAVLIAGGTMLILGPRIGAPEHHHGVMLGAAAGMLFGVSDIAIKALTGMLSAHGILGLLSPWLGVTVVASIVAFYASARSLQDRDAVPVIAVTATAANVSGILGGIIVFGDPFPSHVLGMLCQVFAFTLVVFAAWLTPAPARAVGATATA